MSDIPDIVTAGAIGWKGIVWHHSATKDGLTNDWDGIRRYHTSWRVDGEIVTPEEYERRLKHKRGKNFERPWKDIGYHFGIEWVDGRFVVQIGRSLKLAGAHAGVEGVSPIYNEIFLGVCCVGNFDERPPAAEQWELSLRLARALMAAFSIKRENNIGHREVYDRLNTPRRKSCPGYAFDMEKLRREI